MIILGEMNGLRARMVSTSLGEWISLGNEWSLSPCHPVGVDPPVLGWPSAHGVERVPPQGAPGACGGPCFCVDVACFGVALGTKRHLTRRNRTIELMLPSAKRKTQPSSCWTLSIRYSSPRISGTSLRRPSRSKLQVHFPHVAVPLVSPCACPLS